MAFSPEKDRHRRHPDLASAAAGDPSRHKRYSNDGSSSLLPLLPSFLGTSIVAG